jgi:hypothetical protein
MINEYLINWEDFKKYCEIKTKNRCYLNNNSWRKLREYHLEGYLLKEKYPFGFLLKMRATNPGIFKSIHCAPYFYEKYRRERIAELINVGQEIVSFPKFRKIRNKKIANKE